MGFGGNGGGGSGSISSSSDVALNTPGNDDVLSYDQTTAKWHNKAFAASGVTSVAGRSGAVTLVQADVGLGNVDNTADLSKPVSTATQTALNNKITGYNGAAGLWIGTQAQYDAIGSPSATTLYVIRES